jgi:histidine triad (HIT) family protein
MSQPHHDPACLFCKIVLGEIPSAKILETDHALAFLDINPVNRGHVLLVPKAHHSTLSELSDDLAAETAKLVPRLVRAIRAATGADGLNLIVNNGEVAGQTIHHGHWHLIPRFVDDPVNWPWPHFHYSGDELSQMRSRIELKLSGGE